MNFRTKKCGKERFSDRLNSRYQNFVHPIFTAGDEEQFNSTRIKQSLVKTVTLDRSASDRTLITTNPLVRPWEKYTDLSSRAVDNTFEYLFLGFKKGIFVKIQDNKLESFLPFTNVAFKNEWAGLIKVDPSKYNNIKQLLDHSSQLAGYRPSDVLPVNEWYANNSLVRYEKNKLESSNNITVLYDMYKTLCEKRDVPDVEFFANRRDYPLLTRNGTEPYNHLFGSKHHMMEKQYKTFAPIFSSSISERFADILVPTYEDWMRVVYQETGESILYDCKTYPKIDQTSWTKKIQKAVFRGSTTGPGVTSETNQRLKALEIGEVNKDTLDIGITNWNTRPRKHEDDVFLQTIERQSYPKANRLSPQEQSTYAYILNIQGHVAAYRLAYELSFGSVVLLVDSEWKMWFSRFLSPWKHYVPVKNDLSDLVDQVKWCRDHDVECQTIAQNALQFYQKYLMMDGILDYLQKTLVEVSKMVGQYAYIADLLSSQLMEEKTLVQKYLKAHFRASKEILRFPASPGPRSENVLAGQFLALQGIRDRDIQRTRKLFSSQGTEVNLVTIGRGALTLVEKKVIDPRKQREQIHESFIGLNAVNGLSAMIPNFAYVYGPLNDNFDKIYVEYINGPSLFDWLKSPDFTSEGLINILVQLNLALQVAQETNGFMHYDLYPWNVMLVFLRDPVEFFYKVQPGMILSFKTKIVPVMIDFGKSRAVVYNAEFGGVLDYGFVNLFSPNKALDSLNILLSSLNIVASRLSPDVINKFDGFFKRAGIPDCCENISHYKKYGKLFDLADVGVTPMNFVNYVVRAFGKIRELKSAHQQQIQTPRDNPIATCFQMIYGQSELALAETVNYMGRMTFAKSSEEFTQRYIRRTLIRQTRWLSNEIETRASEKTRGQWEYLKGMMLAMPQLVPDSDVNFSLPSPRKVYLDSKMTQEEIEVQNLGLVRIEGDLVSTLEVYKDSLGVNDSLSPAIEASLKKIPSIFDFLTSVAMMNTSIKIGKLITEISYKQLINN